MPGISAVFHPEAAAEYAEALAWYRNAGMSVADGFEDEIERALRLVEEAPDRWPRHGRRHRRLLVRRYPYSRVYLTYEGRIWIVAVAHSHRRPGYWRHRKLHF